MASRVDTPRTKAGRPIWLRLVFTALNLILAGAMLWLGMSIPSYFRSVSPLVLEAAANGTTGLEERANDQLKAGRPGLADPLIRTLSLATRQPPPANLVESRDQLLADAPLYRWSGGPAPFYEQFLARAPYLREDEPAVIPTLLPGSHREFLLGFLQQSPNQNVSRILGTRQLSGWQRLYPVFSTSGQPLESTILCTGLLEQASALPQPILDDLMEAIARTDDPDALAKIESIYLAILTLGRYTNWLQLKELVREAGTTRNLLLAAQAVQDAPDRMPVLHSALQVTDRSGDVFAYLQQTGDRGWKGLTVALGMGSGAVEALLEFRKPVYQPPAVWNILPETVRESQQAFKGFAEATPGLAIGARALAFALCGFFLVGILRMLILGSRPRTDHRKRILINLDSAVGGILVTILVWVLIEPGLLEYRPNESGILQLKLAQVIPETAPAESESVSSTMIDQVTILILLLFLVIQLLVFILGLIKITEIRRHNGSPDLKLRLLDNEENLFDLGLYVGLGGTVASLILVVLNVVDASLMAAYASTLFGIIFVAILKVGFLRPFRRHLILRKN